MGFGAPEWYNCNAGTLRNNDDKYKYSGFYGSWGLDEGSFAGSDKGSFTGTYMGDYRLLKIKQGRGLRVHVLGFRVSGFGWHRHLDLNSMVEIHALR